MAIISCPFCGHRISDKSASCSKCNKDLSDLTPEKMAALERDKRLNQAQSLLNQSLLALVLFLAGLGVWYWWQSEDGYNQYLAALLAAVGFCWYVITRIRIMMFKRKNKK